MYLNLFVYQTHGNADESFSRSYLPLLAEPLILKLSLNIFLKLNIILTIT